MLYVFRMSDDSENNQRIFLISNRKKPIVNHEKTWKIFMTWKSITTNIKNWLAGHSEILLASLQKWIFFQPVLFTHHEPFSFALMSPISPFFKAPCPFALICSHWAPFWPIHRLSLPWHILRKPYSLRLLIVTNDLARIHVPHALPILLATPNPFNKTK